MLNVVNDNQNSIITKLLHIKLDIKQSKIDNGLYLDHI